METSQIIEYTKSFGKFIETNFDIIITDISMPKMDGVELIKRVRDINSDISIVVYTAHSSKESFQACNSLCIDSYMLKPMELTDIKEILTDIVLKTKQKIELIY